MQPLNVIKDYYGEKLAFYFAWLIHYTGWLIPPMLIGILFSAGLSYDCYYNNETYEQWLNSPFTFFYGIFMMIWATLINESWVRKQNQISNMWLVRNYNDVTTECENYEYEETIDPDT